MKKILVATDGSKNSMECLNVAADYAKDKECLIYVMTVVPFYGDIDLELSPHLRDKIAQTSNTLGEEMLNGAKKILQDKGVKNIETVLSVSASISKDILDFAENNKIDIIFIGGSGTGTASKMLLGSVSYRVVNQSSASVFVVKTA
ncbi:MAG: universal stress protein [Nitrospirae bacterium]|nr:universal stress protein [Nitrospirota bacterium]